MRLRPEPLTGASTMLAILAWGSRNLLILLYTATAVVGTTALPTSALVVVAPLVGIVTALAFWILRVRRQGPDVPPPGIVVPWLVGTALLPFGAGAFGLPGPVAVVVVVSCLALAGVWRLASDGVPSAERSTTDCPPAQQESAWRGEDDAVVRAALRGASLDSLFDQWHLSQRELTRAGRPTHGAVVIRELLVEELHRRDPRGVERWLVEGDARHPQRYVSGDGRLDA